MNDRIDHEAEAREWIDAAMKHPGAVGVTVLAVAEAMLALVEQQRIANLIALMDSPRTATSVSRMMERALMEGEPVANRTIRPDIAAALGIKEGK